jgi:hypothetical protein
MKAKSFASVLFGVKMWLNLLLVSTLPPSICEYFNQSSLLGNSIGTSGFAKKLSALKYS